jgi:signal transduction histidine kinase
MENARLYEDSRRRQEWLRASGEVSRRLLGSSFDEIEMLQQIAVNVQRLAAADVVTVVLPLTNALDEMLVVAATGLGQDELRGLHYDRKDTFAGLAMVDGRGLRFDAVDQRPEIYLHQRLVVPVTDVMALPLTGEAGARGAIVVGRTSRVPFTDSDLEMAETFASQAALALELADVRADHQRLSELEYRDRIARDLHDHVIQRLFAAGLSVQASAAAVSEGPVRARLVRTVDDLDDTIRRVRTSIFALRDPHVEQSLRSTALTVVDQVSPLFSVRPDLQFIGSLDTIDDEDIVADTEAVLRESLTNVARHAHGQEVHVTVQATGLELIITVSDDGIGLGDTDRRSGLANLRVRAERYYGRLDLDDRPEGGLRLRWTIPLPA